MIDTHEESHGMVLHIVTNGHERALATLEELPRDIAAREFDYVEREDYGVPRFVYAYGEWWDVFDTEYVGATQWPTHMRALSDWDGFISLTYGSGVAFRFCNPLAMDSVIVARFYVVSDWERR